MAETTNLIFTDLKANNNKFWTCTLNDDGSIDVTWGRVGKSSQSKHHPGGGQRKCDTLIRGKLKKGYTEVDLVGSETASGRNLNLKLIARDQIVGADAIHVGQLIDDLVDQNVHQITDNTKITYDDATGLFSTPMGIVTQGTIDDARGTLTSIAGSLGTAKLDDLTNSYMRLIPQDIGMRRTEASEIFPDLDAVAAQQEILDKLEVSVETIEEMAANPKDEETEVELPKVFNLAVKIANSADATRLTDWFEESKKRQHGYDRTQVDQVFEIESPDSEVFDEALGGITEVFHGSTAGNCLSIMKTGLSVAPPSTAHVSGKMFGNGIYGATSSTKSLGYSFGRWGGNRNANGWLFICDFAMGKIDEPTHTVSGPRKGFDSVWARARKTSLLNDELIVYRSNQCRLKYLLKCS